MDQKSTISNDSSFVEPQLTDVRSCWPKVKKGVESILKENPKEAQIPSHILMLRAGLCQQSTSGIYSWLPLGKLILDNLKNNSGVCVSLVFSDKV